MIEINWTIGVQFFNFVILLLALNFILFRPVRAILAERKALIDGGHARARDLKEQIEEKMARYQEQLQQAKQQGAEEKNRLRTDAAQQEAAIIGAARDAATARIQAIKERVAGEAAAADAELKKQSTVLAGQVAAKVLGRGI